MDLALPEACDVLVVGGGLAGAAAALWLAEGGAQVVLAEAASRCGLGGSGAGTGICDLGVVEHPHRTVEALGEEGASALFAFADRSRTLAEELGLLADRGVLWAAVEARELDAFGESHRALTAMGRTAEILDGPATCARTGGTFHGGLWLPDGGRLAAGAVVELVERAVRAGVWLHTGDPVHLDDEAGPVVAHLGDQRVRAELVVLAAGVGSGELDARLATAFLPVRDAAIVTAPTDRIRPGVGRAGQGWTSWFQRPDGAVVVSGARWATPHLEVGETDSSRVDPRVRARLEAFARGPLGLEGVPIAGAWAWLFARTRDGLPLVGPMPGHSRRIALLGFESNPATFALAAARAVADGLLGGGGAVPAAVASRRLVRWTG